MRCVGESRTGPSDTVICITVQELPGAERRPSVDRLAVHRAECCGGRVGRVGGALALERPVGEDAWRSRPFGEDEWVKRRASELRLEHTIGSEGRPPKPWCEPTTHRFVRRAFHPTPHHPLECRPEPTPSTPARGGSGLHCRSGASRASSTGGRWSGSAARVLPPICEVSRVVTGTDAGNGGTGANERPSVANSNCLCHQSKRCAVGPRRQKRSDALSEKTKRCAVGSHHGFLSRLLGVEAQVFQVNAWSGLASPCQIALGPVEPIRADRSVDSVYAP